MSEKCGRQWERTQEGSSEEMTFEWGPEGKVGITSSSFRKTGTLGGLSKEMWTRSFLVFAWSLISSYNHHTKLFRLYWRVWVTKKNIGGKTLTHTSDVTASKRKRKPFTEDRSSAHSSLGPLSQNLPFLLSHGQTSPQALRDKIPASVRKSLFPLTGSWVFSPFPTRVIYGTQ